MMIDDDGNDEDVFIIVDIPQLDDCCYCCLDFGGDHLYFTSQITEKYSMYSNALKCILSGTLQCSRQYGHWL